MIGILKYFTFILMLYVHAYALVKIILLKINKLKSQNLSKHHINKSPGNPAADLL